MHVIADNYQLLILTASVVSASSAGKFWDFYSVLTRKRPNFSRAPSARAFGAGLWPRPSATISYYLCNLWHPAETVGERRERASAA